MQAKTKIKNRLSELFEKKESGLLNIYFTAGFPQLNDTVPILKALQSAKVDMIEIGMPFSDPLADGPTIQESGEIALKNGMSLKVLLEQLKDIRQSVNVPILLMGYINPVLQFGVEKFCKKISEIGIDGLIIPDLPFQEYNEKYAALFETYNLSNIFLVTPNTTASRMELIDESANGFIYVVSTSSTTGNTSSISSGQIEYFQRIKNAKLKNPTMIGFNVKDNKSFELACSYANGAIIGSAFIKVLKESKDLEKDIKSIVSGIKTS